MLVPALCLYDTDPAGVWLALYSRGGPSAPHPLAAQLSITILTSLTNDLSRAGEAVAGAGARLLCFMTLLHVYRVV